MDFGSCVNRYSFISYHVATIVFYKLVNTKMALIVAIVVFCCH